MKKILLLLVSSLLIISFLSACTLPATTAPVAPTAQKAAPTSAPPTLAIKTPIPTATKVASFQEILSGTQTALAIIRGGTPEEPTLEPMPGETEEAAAMNGTPEAQISPISPLATTLGTPATTALANSTLMVKTATSVPIVVSVFQGIPGVPTFGILKVTRDATVTIQTNEFPANTKYVVKMGPAFSYALGGTVIGTFDSAKGGTANETFNIPTELKGSDRIDIRVEFPDGRYTYNYFYNLTVN
ncbi:MAG: hypothetical protein AB9891_02335 [Anaerolineaceae bacterium]